MRDIFNAQINFVIFANICTLVLLFMETKILATFPDRNSYIWKMEVMIIMLRDKIQIEGLF